MEDDGFYGFDEEDCFYADAQVLQDEKLASELELNDNIDLTKNDENLALSLLSREEKDFWNDEQIARDLEAQFMDEDNLQFVDLTKPKAKAIFRPTKKTSVIDLTDEHQTSSSSSLKKGWSLFDIKHEKNQKTQKEEEIMLKRKRDEEQRRILIEKQQRDLFEKQQMELIEKQRKERERIMLQKQEIERQNKLQNAINLLQQQHQQRMKITAQFNPNIQQRAGPSSSPVNRSYSPVSQNFDDEINHLLNRTTFQLQTFAGSSSVSPLATHLPAMNNPDGDVHFEKILENLNITESYIKPEDRLKTPIEMTCDLLEHQKLGLQWMLKMEESNRGGILADDMGLGKTIQSIALMCANKSTSQKVKANLIIAPVSLIHQWKQEINDKVKRDPNFPLQKVYIYHGPSRVKDPKFLNKYDVVLTTYGTMTSEWFNAALTENKKKKKQKLTRDSDFVDDDENDDDSDSGNWTTKYGPLFKVDWYRIILDEAHMIKNRSAQSSKAVEELDSDYRWCLTGTPIQNRIDEFFPLIRFLRIQPFCEWSEFNDMIAKHFKKKKAPVGVVVERTKSLIKSCTLHRKKESILDGKPMIEIPEKIISNDQNLFNDDEQTLYQTMFDRAQVTFNSYLRKGLVMKNYQQVLVLILRLRQCCCHPSLCMEGNRSSAFSLSMSEPKEKMDQNEKIFSKMSKVVIQRLIDGDPPINEDECSICLDIMNEGVIVGNCGHFFCGECADTIVSDNKDCPICRNPMRRENLVSVGAFLQKFKPQAVKVVQEDITMNLDEKIKQDKILLKKEWKSSTKLDRLLEMLTESRRSFPGEKTIVFSQFVKFIDLMDYTLKEKGFKFVRYTGSMSAKDRSLAVDKLFNDPEITIILCSIKCASLGLNLTVCNRVILMDVWWNPSIEKQAMDRAHRLGQKKAVIVDRITIKNSIEDRILEIHSQKDALVEGVMGDGKIGGATSRLSLQDLKRLFQSHVEEEEE